MASVDSSIWGDIERVRGIIQTKIPSGAIVPCHTEHSHHYMVTTFLGNPVLDSVTTKTGVLSKGYLKDWGIKLAVDHVREKWVDYQGKDEFEREELFVEASGLSDSVRDDAADCGTKIHKVVEDYLEEWIAKKQRPVDIKSFILPEDLIDSRITSASLCAELFFKDHNAYPIYSELLVASLRLKVAGTLDCLAYIEEVKRKGSDTCEHEMWKRAGSNNDNHVIHDCTKCDRKTVHNIELIDFKSSNSIEKPDYILQTSAYHECLRSMTGIKAKNIKILRLDKKKPVYQVGTFDSAKRRKAIKIFTQVSEISDWSKSDDSEFDKKVKKIMQV